jgi:hypothetical protein
MISHVASPVSASRVEKSMPKPRVLWIDGVGGFAMCDSNEVSLGQSFPGNAVDLAIRGDLSRRALIFRRHGEDHLIQPLQTVRLNGKVLERAAILSDGALLTIGDRVELKYVRPTRLSGTARLELLGHHRWQPYLTAPLLLGESCILGPEPNSHIVCPDWTQRLVLFRHQGEWMCRSSGTDPITVGGIEVSAPFPLVPGQRIRSDEFSMTLE